MATAQEVLAALRDVPSFLGGFPPNDQSLHFELLIAEAFGHLLHLGFYAQDNDDPNAVHKVLWNGNLNPTQKAPSGGADALANAYDYHVLVEATMRAGANQWTMEFAQGIRHGEDFLAADQSIRGDQVFVPLVCPSLYRDTFVAIRNRGHAYPALVPVEVGLLSVMLETCMLAFTVQHAELRMLLNRLRRSALNSRNLAAYNTYTTSIVTEWQSRVLRAEKPLVIGVRAYQAIAVIGGNHASASAILAHLQADPNVSRYFDLLDEKLTIQEIDACLEGTGFAYQCGRTLDDESLYSPISRADCTRRLNKIIEKVEAI